MYVFSFNIFFIIISSPSIFILSSFYLNLCLKDIHKDFFITFISLSSPYNLSSSNFCYHSSLPWVMMRRKMMIITITTIMMMMLMIMMMMMMVMMFLNNNKSTIRCDHSRTKRVKNSRTREQSPINQVH